MADKIIVPAGGATLHGHDEQEPGTEPNQVSHFVPEGTEIQPVGTVRLDDSGNPNGFFASDGYWRALPKTPGYTRDDLTMVPADGSASVVIPVLAD